jgi:hypothetical protein
MVESQIARMLAFAVRLISTAEFAEDAEMGAFSASSAVHRPEASTRADVWYDRCC